MTRSELLRFLHAPTWAVEATIDAQGQAQAALPGMTYVRITPAWSCHSDFRSMPPVLVESHADALRRLTDDRHTG